MIMTIKWGQQRFSQKNLQKHLQKKLPICAYLGCFGRNFPPDADYFVCGASTHLKCSTKISLDDISAYCSTDCICFVCDTSIDNAKIWEKREELLSHPKNQLRSLAHSVGAKISYRPPGEGSRDLSKEGIILHIVQKIFVSQEPLGQTLK
jgi:hypothetical protein